MAMDKPWHAGIGLGVVLLGLPVYALAFARRAPEVGLDPGSVLESSAGAETS
jgi:hypothetical protein